VGSGGFGGLRAGHARQPAEAGPSAKARTQTSGHPVVAELLAERIGPQLFSRREDDLTIHAKFFHFLRQASRHGFFGQWWLTATGCCFVGGLGMRTRLRRRAGDTALGFGNRLVEFRARFLEIFRGIFHVPSRRKGRWRGRQRSLILERQPSLLRPSSRTYLRFISICEEPPA